MNQFKSVIKTSDGFTFYELDNGMIVDNLDADNIDMSWNSLIEFSIAIESDYIRTEKNLYLCIGRNEADCLDEYCEFGATPLFKNKDGQLELSDGCYTLHDFFYNNILEVEAAIDTALELIFNQIHNDHLHGFIEMPQHLGGDKFYFRVNSLSI